MSLKISCPHCSSRSKISKPYPQPGMQLSCPACGQKMTITYPEGVIEKIRKTGAMLNDGSSEDFNIELISQNHRKNLKKKEQKIHKYKTE